MMWLLRLARITLWRIFDRCDQCRRRFHHREAVLRCKVGRVTLFYCDKCWPEARRKFDRR